MDLTVALRPRRSLVLPLLVFVTPALYFVYRDASMGCLAGRSCLGVAHVGYAFAGLAGSYLLAVGVLALVDPPSLADRHPFARLAFEPTDGTLLVLGTFVVAIVAYLLATLTTTIPAWLDLALTPVGLLVGFPFAASYAAMVVVTNAFFSEPPLWFQTAVVAASLAVTAAWLFALATGTAGLLGSWVPSVAGSGR